ncbi:hypothetical protein ACFL20_09095, partial [Spirochaetota bacterium]
MNISINKWKIRSKLISSFAVTVVLLGGVIVYMIMQVTTLRDMQDEGAKRADDAIKLVEVDMRLDELYSFFADTIINRDVAKIKKEYEVAKKQSLKDIETVNKLVDTDAERALAKDFEKYYKKYLSHFDELFILVKGKG